MTFRLPGGAVSCGTRQDHTLGTRERNMSVAKITEISSSSTKSFEDAVNQGIARAEKTLRNVEGAWIKEQKVRVNGGKISEYRVVLKVSFVLSD